VKGWASKAPRTTSAPATPRAAPPVRATTAWHCAASVTSWWACSRTSTSRTRAASALRSAKCAWPAN